jgi:hypothetical protein
MSGDLSVGAQCLRPNSPRNRSSNFSNWYSFDIHKHKPGFCHIQATRNRVSFSNSTDNFDIRNLGLGFWIAVIIRRMSF